jgi:hypothetical protein
MVFWFATPHGLTIWSVDSVVYLEAAANVLSGGGYFYSGPWAVAHSSLPLGVPIILTHYPPLYSLAIAACTLVAKEPMNGAYVVNLVGFVAAAFFAGMVVLQAAPRRPSSAILALLIVALSPHLLKLYSAAFSEAVFIPLALAGQLVLLHFCKSHKISTLCMAALLFGLGSITRYSGVVWIATGSIWMLFWGPFPLARRFRYGVIFGAVASLPFAIFLLRNHLSSGEVHDRTVTWHPIGKEHWIDSTMAISSWFLPWRWIGVGSGVATLGVFLALIVLCYLVARRPEAMLESERPVFGAFYVTTVLFIVLYVLHLVVSISLTDYSTPLDSRILEPVLVALICLMALIPAVMPGGLWRTTALAAGLALLLVSSSRAVGWIAYNRHGPFGYLAREWMDSKTAETIRNLPPDAVIYSNRAEHIYFSLKRKHVFLIPLRWDPMSLIENKNVARDFEKMQTELRRTGGLVVRSHDINFGEEAKKNENDLVPWGDLQDYSLDEVQHFVPLDKVFEDHLWDVFVVSKQSDPVK